MGLLLLAVLAACQSATAAKDDFIIRNGTLVRDNKDFVIQAIRIPELCKQGTSLAVMVPALAHVSEVGGNAVCVDLVGWNKDGTEIDPAIVENTKQYAGKCKDQWMGLVVRVLGDNPDPAFRKNATLTAAKALGDDPRMVYWFDGPDADKCAALFQKKAAKPVVVAAPEKGDIMTLDAMPATPPKKPFLLVNRLPDGPLGDVHFVINGAETDYAALEAAAMRPEEKTPWTPDNSVLSEAERAEGFIALFDGKTLNGWWAKDKKKDSFRVNPEGFIEWQSKGSGALMTHDRYDNFILRMDWMVEKNGNTGVWLRAPRNGRQSRSGFEVQMRGDSDMPEFNNQNTGAIYEVIAPACKAAKPEGQWNELEVICDGPHVKVTLNGKVIQDVNFDDHEELKYRLKKGFICVTDHGNYCGFRNIRLKKL